MKKYLNTKIVMMTVVWFSLLLFGQQSQAQDKQYKARLSVDYQKIMDDRASLLVSGKFKGENGYEPTKDLTLNVYQEINEDSVLLIGQTTTNSQGNAQFFLTSERILGDSIIKYSYLVKIENSKRFKDLKKAVSYRESELNAEAVVKDSIDYISAQLTDASGNPIEGQKLTVMVDRLFAPLTIGKSSYKTNDEGMILVPIKEPLPGVNRELTFEVMHESRKYGIVKKIFVAQIGQPIIDISTFDKRTMWSPPGKTPWFLWVFANLGIAGIWGTMILLVRNMFKIYKS